MPKITSAALLVAIATCVPTRAENPIAREATIGIIWEHSLRGRVTGFTFSAADWKVHTSIRALGGAGLAISLTERWTIMPGLTAAAVRGNNGEATQDLRPFVAAKFHYADRRCSNESTLRLEDKIVIGRGESLRSKLSIAEFLNRPRISPLVFVTATFPRSADVPTVGLGMRVRTNQSTFIDVLMQFGPREMKSESWVLARY